MRFGIDGGQNILTINLWVGQVQCRYHLTYILISFLIFIPQMNVFLTSPLVHGWVSCLFYV